MAFPLANMPLTDINPDLDLLERMRVGDAAAMCALYQRHQGPLYRFAVLRRGSADTAADIVQDVFLALIEEPCPTRYEPERRPYFQPEMSLRG